MARSTRRIDNGTRFFTDYEDQSGDEDTLVIPDGEAIEALSDEDLTALSEQAHEAFEALYGDGKDLSAEDLEALRGLTAGIERIDAEEARREGERKEREDEAAELAAKVRPTTDEADGGDGEDGDGSDDEEGGGDGDSEDENDGDESTESEAEEETVEVTAEAAEEQPESLAASARAKEVRVNLGRVRSKQAATPKATKSGPPTTMRDLVSPAANVEGFAQGMDFFDMGKVVDDQLGRVNLKQYEKAAKANQHLRQQFGVAVIERRFEDGLTIESSDREHVESVLSKAADESRLDGGSLVASGGWCAPSETDYSLFNQGESRDGIIDVPEVGVRRGGINFTKGPDFTSIYQDTGFHYTEQEDIDGDYDGEGGGSKPCFKVECYPFEDVRLDLDGICITAGLLQSRGYPEVIADTIRKALIAHDHRVAAGVVNAMVADSTVVEMPASQVGATAPVLTAIELQVEHYREIHRMSENATLEAKFPRWVRGAVRADLSRRLGIDLISVPNARINQWFTDRGVSPQFIYNWQGLADGVSASGRTSYPTEVDFLLYSAGTWVKGGADILTLDTIYDSVLLGTNDYTALFTEEGWLVAKKGIDSRVVTVNLCPDGATAAGVAIECDGSAGA